MIVGILDTILEGSSSRVPEFLRSLSCQFRKTYCLSPRQWEVGISAWEELEGR